MRTLTFEGFSKRYLHELSGSSTLSLRTLGAKAITGNPRLREPLFLYAASIGKAEFLLRRVGGSSSFEEARKLFNAYPTWERLELALKRSDPSVPVRFLKVYETYCMKRDHYRGEAHTKELIWNKILRLRQEKKISNYRIYKTLGLNPGNANAFLTHGDTSKVSLATARKTLEFIESL